MPKKGIISGQKIWKFVTIFSQIISQDWFFPWNFSNFILWSCVIRFILKLPRIKLGSHVVSTSLTKNTRSLNRSFNDWIPNDFLLDKCVKCGQKTIRTHEEWGHFADFNGSVYFELGVVFSFRTVATSEFEFVLTFWCFLWSWKSFFYPIEL